MSMGQGAHIATATTLISSGTSIMTGNTVNFDAETTAETGTIKKGTLTIEIAVDANNHYTSSANAVDWVTFGTPSQSTTCAATFTPTAPGTYGFRASFDPKGAKFNASTSDVIDVVVSTNGGSEGGSII